MLLKRHGWSSQVPARRPIEWDENVVAGAGWVKETWPSVEEPWRPLDAWLVFEDEASFSMGSAKILVKP